MFPFSPSLPAFPESDRMASQLDTMSQLQLLRGVQPCTHRLLFQETCNWSRSQGCMTKEASTRRRLGVQAAACMDCPSTMMPMPSTKACARCTTTADIPQSSHPITTLVSCRYTLTTHTRDAAIAFQPERPPLILCQALSPITCSSFSVVHTNISVDFAPALDKIVRTDIPTLFTPSPFLPG